MDKSSFERYYIDMIFLAYNLFKYRVKTKKNISFKEFVLDKIDKGFPGEDYILPYSQYTRAQLAEKLNVSISEIKGTFRQDLDILMSKSNKLVFFPTDSFYIGSGMYIEIECAKRYNLPIYGYNIITDSFSQNFDLQTTEMTLFDEVMGSIFYKKVTFL